MNPVISPILVFACFLSFENLTLAIIDDQDSTVWEPSIWKLLNNQSTMLVFSNSLTDISDKWINLKTKMSVISRSGKICYLVCSGCFYKMLLEESKLSNFLFQSQRRKEKKRKTSQMCQLNISCLQDLWNPQKKTRFIGKKKNIWKQKQLTTMQIYKLMVVKLDSFENISNYLCRPFYNYFNVKVNVIWSGLIWSGFKNRPFIFKDNFFEIHSYKDKDNFLSISELSYLAFKWTKSINFLSKLPIFHKLLSFFSNVKV